MANTSGSPRILEPSKCRSLPRRKNEVPCPLCVELDGRFILGFSCDSEKHRIHLWQRDPRPKIKALACLEIPAMEAPRLKSIPVMRQANFSRRLVEAQLPDRKIVMPLYTNHDDRAGMLRCFEADGLVIGFGCSNRAHGAYVWELNMAEEPSQVAQVLLSEPQPHTFLWQSWTEGDKKPNMSRQILPDFSFTPPLGVLN
jgi:hypothetical protein